MRFQHPQAVLDASLGVGVHKVHTENYMRGGTPLRYLDWALPAGVWPTRAAMLPMLLYRGARRLSLDCVVWRPVRHWGGRGPSCSVLANSGKIPMSWQSPVNEI